MTNDLINLVERLGEPHVVVVGDVMLDRYIWGNAERISQEAPVILLRADHREERLGGASSVATLLQALEAKVSLAGVVGADTDGKCLRQVLLDLNIDQEAVVTDPSRLRQLLIAAVLLGGDEFVVVLTSVHHPDVAIEIARRVVASIASPMEVGDQRLRVTTSVGVVVADGHESADALLDDADRALYRAKRSGRGTYAVAS